jgi:hypothetical protein
MLCATIESIFDIVRTISLLAMNLRVLAHIKRNIIYSWYGKNVGVEPVEYFKMEHIFGVLQVSELRIPIYLLRGRDDGRTGIGECDSTVPPRTGWIVVVFMWCWNDIYHFQHIP